MFANRQKTISLVARSKTRGNFILALIIGSVFLFVILREKKSTLPLPQARVPLPPLHRSSSLVFWATNNHDGCRVDTATLLQGLNQTVIIADHVGRKNPYLSAFTRPNIVFLRETHTLAPVIDSHRGHSESLLEADVQSFFSFYHNDSVMSTVNAFYCSFPMSLCEIYMPLNRSIIWLPAHRFTLARCSRSELDRLISHLQQSVQSDRQPKHFLAAGGRYDQEYIKYYTGLDAILLPTNAFWYAFNVTRWTEAKSEILVGPLQHSSHPLIQRMTDAAGMRKSPFRFATAKSLYGHYELQQISDHRAIVLLPYAVLSYGITELYALGIPIFVPSIEFLVQLKLVYDRTLLDDFLLWKTSEVHRFAQSTSSIGPSSFTWRSRIDRGDELLVAVRWLLPMASHPTIRLLGRSDRQTVENRLSKSPSTNVRGESRAKDSIDQRLAKDLRSDRSESSSHS